MVSTTALLSLLAVAPASAIASAVSTRDDSEYTLREVGSRNTLDWRIWLEKDGNPISFWHDIPLYPNPNDTSIINFYTEIPRWTDGKLETKRDEPLNPIFHDEKKDVPRFIYSVWPHRTYPFNYGSIPQTWENPNLDHEISGLPGDNDPIDVFDISSFQPAHVGEIRQVKVLGGLAMIDEETTDWKMIVIDINDPLANIVNSVDDLDQFRPGLRESFHEWFIYYKVVKGDGTNTIVDEKYQSAEVARHAIEESHGWWEDMLKGIEDPNEIALNQTSHPTWCKTYIPSEDATEAFDIPAEASILPPAERPEEFDHWFYLDDEYNLIVLPGQ